MGPVFVKVVLEAKVSFSSRSTLKQLEVYHKISLFTNFHFKEIGI